MNNLEYNIINNNSTFFQFKKHISKKQKKKQAKPIKIEYGIPENPIILYYD